MATVSDLMTPDPRTLAASATTTEAARAMRDADVGAVLVSEQDSVTGILTDRDIAIRAVAEGRDPDDVRVGEICTTNPVALRPDDDLREAVERVRDSDVRRLPVLDDSGTAVGILSLGDLAIELDPGSALADISSEPADR